MGLRGIAHLAQIDQVTVLRKLAIHRENSGVAQHLGDQRGRHPHTLVAGPIGQRLGGNQVFQRRATQQCLVDHRRIDVPQALQQMGSLALNRLLQLHTRDALAIDTGNLLHGGASEKNGFDTEKSKGNSDQDHQPFPVCPDPGAKILQHEKP